MKIITTKELLLQVGNSAQAIALRYDDVRDLQLAFLGSTLSENDCKKLDAILSALCQDLKD